MTDVSYLSQAQRSVIQSSSELMALINRVTSLQQEQKKYENKNEMLQQKVDKIYALKKETNDDREKLRRYEASRNQGLEEKQKHIVSIRTEQRQQKDGIVKALHLMRSQEYVAIKQQSLISELRMREMVEMEQSKRRQQAAEVQGWKNRQKESISLFWEKRMHGLKESQMEAKEKLMEQTQLQQQAIDQLANIEMELINRLQESQQMDKQLHQQLNQVMTLSPQEYQSIYPPQPQPHDSGVSVRQAQKFVNESPYVSIPNVHRSLKTFKQPKQDQEHSQPKLKATTLPKLRKPNFKEQQEHIQRLYQPKVSNKEKEEKAPQEARQPLKFNKQVVYHPINTQQNKQKFKEETYPTQDDEYKSDPKEEEEHDEYENNDYDDGFDNESPPKKSEKVKQEQEQEEAYEEEEQKEQQYEDDHEQENQQQQEEVQQQEEDQQIQGEQGEQEGDEIQQEEEEYQEEEYQQEDDEDIS